MNRNEVIMTIKKAGTTFGQVMCNLCGEEYAAGYNRAVKDMIRLFNEAPIDPNFEAEREKLLLIIDNLTAENERLEQEVCEKHATIQRLLSHVNVAEVIGVNIKKRGDQKVQRRGVSFMFK